MNLLVGLGANYNAIATTINSKDERISLEAVHNMLISYDHRLKQQKSIDNSSVLTVNYASSFNNR